MTRIASSLPRDGAPWSSTFTPAGSMATYWSVLEAALLSVRKDLGVIVSVSSRLPIGLSPITTSGSSLDAYTQSAGLPARRVEAR